MSAIVDTQVLLWYVFDNTRLSSRAANELDRIADAGDLVLVPTISLVEIEYLRDKRVISETAYDKLQASLENPEFAWKPAPLDLNVAKNISQVPRDTVPDMPDRIIAATALTLGLPLVSSDSRIHQVLGINVIW